MNGGGSSRRVLAIASLASFLGFLDVTIVNVAFPSISRTFGTSSPAHLSWILNSYNVLFAAFLLPCGVVADRLGSSRTLIGGVALFGVTSGLCAAAPSINLLIAARALQALAAALMIPSSLAVLLAATSRSQRPAAIAAWSASAAVAAGIGPSLGGFLVEASSWRLVFLVNVPVALFLLAASVSLPSTPRLLDRRPDLLGGAAISLALGFLALGISKGEDWGWTSTANLACYLVSALMLGVFALRTYLRPNPMIAVDLFRDPERTTANVATVVFSVAFYAGILNNVLFLTGVWGYSILEAGLAISPAPLTSAAVGMLAARLLPRFGSRPLAALGCVVYGCGGIGFLLRSADVTPDFLSVWLPAALLMGCGIGLVFASLGASAAASLRESDFATGSALNTVARQLGAVIGTALVFSILHEGLLRLTPGPYQDVWALCLGVSLAAMAVALLLPGRQPAPSLVRSSSQ